MKDRYFIILSIIIMVLITFSSYNLGIHRPVHFYEFFGDSAYFYTSLTHFDFAEAYKTIYTAHTDKFFMIRSVIPYFLLGISLHSYLLSNLLINGILLILIYFLVKKNYGLTLSRIFIYGILVSRYFIDTSRSYYMFLTFSLLLTYFLFYLETIKIRRSSFFFLSFLVCFLFFVKNATYFLLPFILLSFLVYYLIIKRFNKFLYLFTSVCFGFMLFFIVAYHKFYYFSKDIFTLGIFNYPPTSWIDLVLQISSYFLGTSSVSSNINFFFLNKFEFPVITVLFYFCLGYLLYKKKNYIISIAIIQEISLFILSNAFLRDPSAVVISRSIFGYFYFFNIFILLYTCKLIFKKYFWLIIFIFIPLLLINFISLDNDVFGSKTSYLVGDTPIFNLSVEKGSKVYLLNETEKNSFLRPILMFMRQDTDSLKYPINFDINFTRYNYQFIVSREGNFNYFDLLPNSYIISQENLSLFGNDSILFLHSFPVHNYKYNLYKKIK